jgi:ribonuclease HII
MLPFLKENCVEVGMDEAGRGPLIGRVYVAVVIWPPDLTPNTDDQCQFIIDSKKMTRKKREEMVDYIKEHAIEYSIEYAESEEIDEKNILNAVIDCWHRGISQLKTTPEHLIVDGNRFKPYNDIPHICVKGGDAKYLSIAAASILAKVAHDNYILQLLEDNPELEKYGIQTNMGYGTKKHMEAIKIDGITTFHRKSFTINSKKNRKTTVSSI